MQNEEETSHPGAGREHPVPKWLLATCLGTALELFRSSARVWEDMDPRGGQLPAAPSAPHGVHRASDGSLQAAWNNMALCCRHWCACAHLHPYRGHVVGWGMLDLPSCSLCRPDDVARRRGRASPPGGSEHRPSTFTTKLALRPLTAPLRSPRPPCKHGGSVRARGFHRTRVFFTSASSPPYSWGAVSHEHDRDEHSSRACWCNTRCSSTPPISTIAVSLPSAHVPLPAPSF